MIRHVVMVKARADLPAGELEAVFAGLSGLKAWLPGMLAFAGGRDVSPEGLQRGYTHAFTIDFADAAARDAYLVDEEHRRLGSQLRAAAAGGRDGLLVVDIDG
jgi:hypothetical protein